jgi:NHL repeat
VKPTERTAKTPSLPAGCFATLRRALLHTQGSGASLRTLIATPLITLCAFAAPLALSVGVAGAAVPKLASSGNFHAEGASGVAVDQSSGDVFVTSFIGLTETGELAAGGHGEEFDASGKALSPPPPFAEGLHYGTAVNPTNGRLYVASPFGEIEVYDPNTGAQLSSFSVPAFFSALQGLFENNEQIATDSAGDVYVPNVPEDKVFKYSETGTLLETFTGSGAHALNRPTGVAVDSSGSVWVADDGNNRIEEFSAAGAFLSEFESEGVRALALDGHGDVLAIVNNSVDDCGAVNAPCEHLVEYSASGEQLADVGAGYFGSSRYKTFKDSMVAVDEASGRVYVTDGLKNVVWVYLPSLAPVLGQESAAEVGTSEAKLGALVQPGGVQATYRFEYDTREYSEGEGPHGTSVPSPEGSVGESFSSRVVWASAKGLAPGTTYHYRAIVTNGLGTVVGPDQTFTTETVTQATCPNEAARSGFSTGLPECRAYELVTPPSKLSAQPDTKTEGTTDAENAGKYLGGLSHNIAAIDGNRFAYEAAEAMPGSQSAGLEFIAARGANGWTTEDVLPLRPYTGGRCTFPVAAQTEVVQYSPDLSKAVLVDNGTISGFSSKWAEICRGERVEVVSGEPFEQNLLARDNEDGAYQLVNLTPAGVVAEPAIALAASADLNVVVFSERAKLVPDAVSGAANLYEWNEGALRLLRLELPSGAPVTGSVLRMSADGSDLFFTSNGNLYVRVHGEHTVQADEARGGSGPGGGGELAAVSADGSQVLFTADAAAGLTGNTVAGSGANLYRYDVGTSQLSDLTPVSDAKASLLGISQDGSYVYFSSDGVQSGTQTNQFGETAQNGQPNLYLARNGTVTFVTNANLMVSGNGGQHDAISQNGGFLAFNATSSLTGYNSNNNDEIYLYSAAANRFECASCNPSGEPPTLHGTTLGAVPHGVSDNGHVFFEADEALVPRDTNGQFDAYEFNYNGGLHLISTGTGSGASVLLDASVNGNDVFFLTPQSLLPQDGFQEARKIYDARVGGGFPETASPPACTTADACRSAATPQPTIYGAPSSQTFSGAGNVGPPVETKPKKKTKPKKAKVKACKRDKHKRARCAARARRAASKAKSNRGGK